jgi:hypothetical protein
MSSISIITILGTLRLSAHNPLFAGNIDKTTAAMISGSAAILFSKGGSMFVVEADPTVANLNNMAAPVFEMDCPLYACTAFISPLCDETKPQAPNEYLFSPIPSQLFPHGRTSKGGLNQDGMQPKTTPPTAWFCLALEAD